MEEAMKKTIRDFDLQGKRLIIRVDFNVPMKDGKIIDDTRIEKALPTILYAKEHGAKILLMSHLGRIKTKEDLEKNTLYPVAKRLEELIKTPVLFVSETRGSVLEHAVSSLNDGDICLMENTRFEDLDGKKESQNDEELGKYWASFGDLFINDAFGTAHRSHASNVGIARHLPSGIGFLMEEELKYLDENLKQPEKPYVVLLGGAKVSDKIGLLSNLLPKVDFCLIGGAMAYTFLKAEGLPIGKSLFEEEKLTFCKELLEKYKEKIILPTDHLVQRKEEIVSCFLTDTKEEDIGYDIGKRTVKVFQMYLKDAKTIVWNGPMGMYEDPKFASGTKEIGEILSENPHTKIVCGGDCVAAVTMFDLEKKMTHISTGGGAALELLEGKELPGVAAIDEKTY